MKKNYIFKFILFLIPVTGLILISASGGRDGGYSGSPGDSSNTCTSCHSGGNFGATVTIQTEVPAGGYALNTSYGIQVDVNGSSGSKHGFQLTAERISDNSKIGTFTDDGTDNKLVNGGTHVTHTSTGNSKKTWNFSWKSPATDVGAIKFYVAANAANGNGNTDGDQVVTASTGDFNVLGLSKEVKLDFAMYPNPSTDYLTIQLPSGSLKADISVFDLTGRLIKSSEITSTSNKLDIQYLSTGMYLLIIESEGKIGSKQFIKN
jgi:hypothetical protein